MAIIFFVVGLLLIFTFVQTHVVVPEGSIGIDQNGNWYGSGSHITLEKVEMVSLKGSVPLWNHAELLYNLTPEEIMTLERGPNFQERLREDTTISIRQFDMTINETSRGINKSHLKVLISF